MALDRPPGPLSAAAVRFERSTRRKFRSTVVRTSCASKRGGQVQGRAAGEPREETMATIERRQGKHRRVENESDEILKSRSQAGRSSRYLRQTNGGVEYIENERYYLFKRTRSR